MKLELFVRIEMGSLNEFVTCRLDDLANGATIEVNKNGLDSDSLLVVTTSDGQVIRGEKSRR
jgi:hypothetical protein